MRTITLACTRLFKGVDTTVTDAHICVYPFMRSRIIHSPTFFDFSAVVFAGLVFLLHEVAFPTSCGTSGEFKTGGASLRNETNPFHNFLLLLPSHLYFTPSPSLRSAKARGLITTSPFSSTILARGSNHTRPSYRLLLLFTHLTPTRAIEQLRTQQLHTQH